MSIALRDEEDGILRTAALYANGENYLTLVNGTPVLTTGSIVGRAWEQREFLHIPNVMQEPGLIAGETPELHSLMVMPMYSHARGLGVVTVGCEYPYAYTETDVVVFQQMAGVLAAAIENAVTYTRSQRQAKNEGLVNDISGRLQQQVDIESMLNVTMNELGKALGARRARIRLGTIETDGDDI
jgi:GAF domain-containing protein